MTEPEQPAIDHGPSTAQAQAPNRSPGRNPGRDPADPGSPASRLIALVLAVLGAAAVILWQNTPEDIQYKILGATPPEAQITDDTPAPGRFGQADLGARIFIKLRTAHHSGFFGAETEEMTDTVMNNIETVAIGPEDRVRAIIMSAEFEGRETAINRITALRSELTDQIIDEDPGGGPYNEGDRISAVLDDLRTLETVYMWEPDRADPDELKRIEHRYGVLGRAAATHGLDDHDPRRAPAVSGFAWTATFLLGVGLLMIVAPIVGVVLLIVGLVRIGNSRTRVARFTRPEPGGSVFLETYALFVLGFLVLTVGITALAAKVDQTLAILSLPLQWGLMLLVAWPVARGMKVRDWRHAIGLTRGEGVLKEIWTGFLAYLACVPLYYIAVLVTFVIIIISASQNAQSTSEAVPSNPIIDIVSTGSPVVLVLIFTLATIWAPITEELIFRGALHRHFRARLHWIVVPLITGLLFAFMHSYGPLMVAPLITLGFVFAIVREWRGSIIAPMTMHFVHNCTLMLIMITLVTLLKDPPM